MVWLHCHHHSLFATCHSKYASSYVRREPAGRQSIPHVRKFDCNPLHFLLPTDCRRPLPTTLFRPRPTGRPLPTIPTTLYRDERSHERFMCWYRATDARYLRRSWEHQPQDKKLVLLQVPTSLLDVGLPYDVDLLLEQKGLCVVADLERPREWCNLEHGGCVG